jgi:hypothetical protein
MTKRFRNVVLAFAVSLLMWATILQSLSIAYNALPGPSAVRMATFAVAAAR